jgi:CRISPR system Cascade subunit CasA
VTYDLRRAPWLPLRRRSGTLEWSTVASIVRGTDGLDPIVAISSPRADFDAAVTEFLIGLLTAAFKPPDEKAWLARWKSPPSESELQAALDALPDAFDLDGESPRFLQDLSPADLSGQSIEPIQELLLNAKNGGLFIKPETVKAMGRPAAAMALLVMQTYSTAGGRGYRTSMRGGGPLTTLVDPRDPGAPEVGLWQLLWANVETGQQLESKHRRGGRTNDSDVYPWLAPTRISGKNETTTPDDADALQAYFGMPRRIGLEISDTPGVCDITGLPDEHPVTGVRAKSYGVNYVGWMHPLSPYYAGKNENEKLPVHPQPGGIGWRDWLSLLHDQPDAGTQPAATVTHFRARRARQVGLSAYVVRAFGYDASNAKLRAWVSSTLPEFASIDDECRKKLIDAVRGLIEATDIAAFVLKAAVVNALYGRGDDVKGDPANVRPRLWNAMESTAYENIKRLAFATVSEVDDLVRELNERFRNTLAQTAAGLFDEYAPADSTDPTVLRRLIKARWNLVTTLAGYGKLGEKIYKSLSMASPADKRRADGGKSSMRNKKSGAAS